MTRETYLRHKKETPTIIGFRHNYINALCPVCSSETLYSVRRGNLVMTVRENVQKTLDHLNETYRHHTWKAEDLLEDNYEYVCNSCGCQFCQSELYLGKHEVRDILDFEPRLEHAL